MKKFMKYVADRHKEFANQGWLKNQFATIYPYIRHEFKIYANS